MPVATISVSVLQTVLYEMQACRKEVKELMVNAKRKAEELASTAASLDAAAAESRVVGKEREQLKREWTEMFSAHDSLVNRINTLERQLSQSHATSRVCSHLLSYCISLI
jgi:predicted  nucleic acid-binding Zn-ribbon protein